MFRPYLKAAKKSSVLKITAILEDTLRFIVNNSNSIQALLSENGDSAFQKKFFRNSIEQARQFTKAASVKQSNEKMEGYGSVFWAGGMLALVQERLQNGMYTPVPDMAKMLVRLMRDPQDMFFYKTQAALRFVLHETRRDFLLYHRCRCHTGCRLTIRDRGVASGGWGLAGHPG